MRRPGAFVTFHVLRFTAHVLRRIPVTNHQSPVTNNTCQPAGRPLSYSWRTGHFRGGPRGNFRLARGISQKWQGVCYNFGNGMKLLKLYRKQRQSKEQMKLASCNALKPRLFQVGYTLMEVVMAVALLAIMMVSLYGGISS